MKKQKKLFAILIAALSMGSLSAQTDVTNRYLKNAGLSSLDGWTRTEYTDYKTNGDVPVIEFYHTWSANAGAAIGNKKDFYFKQTATLPAGEYRLAVNAFYREGNGNGTNTKAYIFAGEQQKYIVGLSAGALNSYSGSNDLYKAANAFSKGAFSNEFDFTVEQETTMEIGFKGYIDTYCSWCILGPVKLLQYSMDDFNAELTAARTKLQGLLTSLNNAMANKVNDLLSETADVPQTKAAILEATAKVNALYNEALEMQTLIANTNAVIAVCENIFSNSEEFEEGAKDAFVAIIETAKNNIQSAETVEDINAVYNTVEKARQEYIKKANPLNGILFDYTFMVVNPEFDEGTEGWTYNTGAPNWGIATNQGGAITGNYFENWKWESYTGEIYQELTGLPSGKYILTIAAFRDQLIDGASDGDAVYVFSNEEEALVDAATPAFYSTEVSISTGILRFGIKSKVARYRWMGIDNVSLSYKGFDAEIAKTGIRSLISQAEELVKKPMAKEVRATLNQAIAEAKGIMDTTNPTFKELDAMTKKLIQTIEEANASNADYYSSKKLLVAALERFESDFNDGANGALRFIPAEDWINILNAVADAAVAKDNTNNHDEFAQATENLHAAMDAVYASYVKYSMLVDYTSLIGNADCANNDAWSGSGRTTTTSQHWSGNGNRVYFTQNHENGAARSQTITLPKTGSYLLKVAVRAIEAASYAEILINGVSYKTIGAHGRTGGTIATDGTEWENVDAGKAAGKTFANGNKGYGWVYTYIYFKAEAGENTIAINLSNANSGREANCGGMELYYLRPNYVVEENNVVKHYGIYDEAIATTHTTHDVTNATLTNKAIGVENNRNALIIAKSGQVSNQSNVIIGSTVASLALTDGYAFNAHDNFTATKLSYGRQLTKDTWLTICLPFDYTIPEGVKVETLTEIDTKTKTFTFDEVTGGKMTANTPYIIKNSTATAALFNALSNAEVKATPEAMEVTVNGVDAEFIGTYAPKSSTGLMEDDKYDILFFGTDGQLYYLSNGVTSKEVTINPFRAYIRIPKGKINWSDGQKARVRHRNSETTDIDTLESTDNRQQTTVIYDMHGRRVTEMMKGGMYIVNGRKVVVK